MDGSSLSVNHLFRERVMNGLVNLPSSLRSFINSQATPEEVEDFVEHAKWLLATAQKQLSEIDNEEDLITLVVVPYAIEELRAMSDFVEDFLGFRPDHYISPHSSIRLYSSHFDCANIQGEPALHKTIKTCGYYGAVPSISCRFSKISTPNMSSDDDYSPPSLPILQPLRN